MLLRTVVLLVIGFCLSFGQNMPPPFTRELQLQTPPMQGQDVVILQNLIIRSRYVLNCSENGFYDNLTAQAVQQFQLGNKIQADSIFGPTTATLLLEQCSCDWYRDDGVVAGSLGYKYKVLIQVFANRSYEHLAILFDANNTVLHQFRVRAHGHDNAVVTPPWPSWSNTVGLNQFTSDGNTPTGLFECDLNSPEDDPSEYGPFPINRFVVGLKGNGKFLLPPQNAIRTGILMHTGIWYPYGWKPNQDMPNSSGCVHGHPVDIEIVWKKLISIGVEVRPNTNGKQPYPYKPQGLMSVEWVGCQ